MVSDTRDYKGPDVKLKGIKCLSCEEGPFTPEQELLQLTDLLLGSVASAIEPKSERETKQWFAKNIALLMEDIRKKPWKQEYRLHRKFSVSYFPDADGAIYNDGLIGINKDTKQLGLF
ncbi:MAG: hypothetical protein FJ242_07610 [Nitrospira sp.]|nr:hypothetical protein [Nitrospira sp.]